MTTVMELSSPPSLAPTFAEYHNNYDDDDGAVLLIELYNPYAISLIPKIPALISIVCAIVFIHELLVDMKTNPNRRGDKRVIPNMLLALSASDLSFGISWFLGPWLAPKNEIGIWGNIGNIGSCTFVGVLVQFGMISSSLCNVGLSLYYLLIVKYNWRDARRIERFEKWEHLFIWIITVPLTIIPIVFDMYNFDGANCWISESPSGCNDSYAYSKNEYDCARGEHAWIVLVIVIIILIVSFFVCSVIMGIIYNYVRALEAKISKYSGSIKTNNIQDQKNSLGQYNCKTSAGTNIKTESLISDGQSNRFDKDKQQHKNNNDGHENKKQQAQTYYKNDCAHHKQDNYDDDDDDDDLSHMDGDETQEFPIETTQASRTVYCGQNTSSIREHPSTIASSQSLALPNQQSDTFSVNKTSENLQLIQAQRNVNREKSKRVALQGMWYIAAFLLTFAFSILAFFLYEAGVVFTPLDYASYAMLPLQGFFSFFAFCRTRDEMKTKGGKFLKQIIFFWDVG